MNILTFDIEEWYINKKYHDNDRRKNEEYDRLLDHILCLLDDYSIKATFFCLGKIASDFPYVVKKIYSYGHEIGCHSNAHKWINKMTTEEFQQDTYIAINSLEDLIGEKIVSFRAPAFSIGSDNKWALEVLSENGIVNDSSIFPGVRDFGGFPNFSEQTPCKISYNGVVLNEFPIPLFEIPVLNKKLAYSGGGYFRLLPYSFVRHEISSSPYNMCYFHIADLLSEREPLMTRQEFERYFKEDGTFVKRALRYFKSNVGRGQSIEKLVKLLSQFKFVSIKDYLAQTGNPSKVIAI